MLINHTSLLLLLLLALAGCGREIVLTNNKLERWNSVTFPELTANQEGTLVRGNSLDHIVLNNNSLKVSTYSSHDAKTFINSRPAGSQTPVRFKGKIVSGEIELEMIEPR
jgi:hypothetical protein